jgi:hypothetical protein
MVQSVFQNGGLVGVAKAYLESSGIGGSQYQSGIWNLESVYESVLANPGVSGELPKTPQLIGYTNGSASNGGAVTLDLTNLIVPASSSDFSNGTVQEGDLIVFAYGAGTRYVSSMNVSTSGYTNVFGSITGNDTFDCVGGIAYKVATASDTSVSTTSVTGTSRSYASSLAAAFVIRSSTGSGTFSLENSQSSSKVNGTIPTIPSLTSASDSFALAFAVSGHALGSVTMTGTGFSNFTSRGQNDSRDGTIGMGYTLLNAGDTFSPSVSMTTNIYSSAVAGTVEFTLT